LQSILADEEIRLATTGVPEGERPVVWLSKRSSWEPTATKGFLDRATGIRRNATIEEMVRLAGGFARIAVDSSGLSTWIEHRRIGRIRPEMARCLVITARRVGANPADWLVSYEPILWDRWISVETSIDGREWSVLLPPSDEEAATAPREV
jgi:hypothetical protein